MKMKQELCINVSHMQSTTAVPLLLLNVVATLLRLMMSIMEHGELVSPKRKVGEFYSALIVPN